MRNKTRHVGLLALTLLVCVTVGEAAPKPDKVAERDKALREADRKAGEMVGSDSSAHKLGPGDAQCLLELKIGRYFRIESGTGRRVSLTHRNMGSNASFGESASIR